MTVLKEMREQFDDIGVAVKKLVSTARAENRDLTAAEARLFDNQAAEAERLKQAIRSEEKRIREMVTAMNPNATWGGDARRGNAPALQLPVNGVPVGEGVAPIPATVRTNKLKAFRDERTAYACGQWLKGFVSEVVHGVRDQASAEFCSKLGWQITNVGTEGSGPGGGYLVPTPLAQTIIDTREEVGVARRVCSIIPMTADTLSLPKRAGGLTVYGGSEAPSVDMTDSTKEWGQVELHCRKRYVAALLSQELIDDAIISIVDNYAVEMAYALARAEDQELIDGDGGSAYRNVQGLKNKIGAGGVVDCATGHDTWAEIDNADVTKLMGKLPTEYQRAPVWICSSEFYHEVLLRLAATAGGNSMVDMIGGPNGQPAFLGKPVYFSPFMPTSGAAATVCAFYGTFSQGVILGDRTGVRFGRSDDYLFLRDIVALKATSRYDIQVHEPGDGDSAGAFVALKTAA